MSDIPISDTDASLWRDIPYSLATKSSILQIASFVASHAGKALQIESGKTLLNADSIECLALAAVAQRLALSRDVVGSLLFLAARHHQLFALGAFALALVDAAGTRRGEGPVEPGVHRYRRQAIADVLRRLKSEPTGKDIFAAALEMEAAAKAVVTKLRANLTSESKSKDRKGVIVAPGLTSVGHLGGDSQHFLALAKPMPLWQAKVSVDVIRVVLGLEFPHLAGFAALVAEVVVGQGRSFERPLLMVGPPGAGKDSIFRRAIYLSGRPSLQIDLAGSSDSRMLRGTARGWASASPSLPIATILQTGFANPVLHFSELDKAGGDRRNGVVLETLLAWAEPTTARSWLDEGLACSVDLSNISMVGTANSVADLPAPLRTRLRIIKVGGPRAEHVDQLVLRARERLAAELDMPITALPTLPETGARLLKRKAAAERLNLRMIDRVVRALVGLGPSLSECLRN